MQEQTITSGCHPTSTDCIKALENPAVDEETLVALFKKNFVDDRPHMMHGLPEQFKLFSSSSVLAAQSTVQKNPVVYPGNGRSTSATDKGPTTSQVCAPSSMPVAPVVENRRMITRRFAALNAKRNESNVQTIAKDASIKSAEASAEVPRNPELSLHHVPRKTKDKVKSSPAKPNDNTEHQLEEFLKILPGSREKLRDLCMGNTKKCESSIHPLPGDIGDINRPFAAVVDALIQADTGRNVPPNKESLIAGRPSLSMSASKVTQNTDAGCANGILINNRIPVKCNLQPDIKNGHACQVHHSRYRGVQHDYASYFEEDDSIMEKLRGIFIKNQNHPNYHEAAKTVDDQDTNPPDWKGLDSQALLEWFPVEPSMTKGYVTDVNEISDMIKEAADSHSIEDSDADCSVLQATNIDTSGFDLDIHIKMQQRIHEALYSTSDMSSLRSMEKFMVELLQPDSLFGTLSPHGFLMGYISLGALRRHMFQLHALYEHPEMSAIRELLYRGEDRYIGKVLSISEANSNGQINDELANEAIKEILQRIERNEDMHNPVSIKKPSALSQLPKMPPFGTKVKNPVVHSLLNMKSNRRLLTAMDELSASYEQGCESHFPRFVCGSIDRRTSKTVETLSIPYDKTDRRSIHVQFERYHPDFEPWPLVRYLPRNMMRGMRVQVNASKVQTAACWSLGTVTSVASGNLIIAIDYPNSTDTGRTPVEQYNKSSSYEKMFMMRNLLPPNVPTTRIEKSQWRLLPIPFDTSRHVYIGSCISFCDYTLGGYVDMVITNINYKDGAEEGVAAVKCPSDESEFQCLGPSPATSNSDRRVVDSYNYRIIPNTNGVENGSIPRPPVADYSKVTHTCHCRGHTLRVFEGVHIDKKPLSVVLRGLADRKQITVDIESLKGYKLNYDLQAHFDFHPEAEAVETPVSQPNVNTTTTAFQHCVWVVPRHLRRSEIKPDTGIANRVGSNWFFEPEKTIIMFPFNRAADIMQDSTRMVAFLHPELNYNALITGIWSLRGIKANCEDSQNSSAIPHDTSQSIGPTVSYTRSQKAATREVKMSDIVAEACNGIYRCSISLIQRLMGCNSVISLWMAMDGFNPDNESSSINLAVKIPLQPNCAICKGSVYAVEQVTKTITVDSDEEMIYGTSSSGERKPLEFPETSRDIPVFRDLEQTEVVIQRMRNLAVSRWRLTREYLASYTVDDEIYPAMSRSQQQNQASQQARNNAAKSTFISKFVNFMGDIKKTKGDNIDAGLYKRAFQWSDRYFNTRGIEETLMQGWGSFLTNKTQDVHSENRSIDQVETKATRKGAVKDTNLSNRDCSYAVSQNTKSNEPEKDPNKSGTPNGKNVKAVVYTPKRKPNAPERRRTYSTRKRKADDDDDEDFKPNETTRNGDYSSNVRQPTLGTEKRVVRPVRIRVGKVARNEYTSPFRDKDIRFKFVSVVRWDEDLEPTKITTIPTTTGL